jgi:mannose-6-phosphate isomerase
MLTPSTASCGSEVKLSRGELCFLSAADGAVTVIGKATVFVAAVG